LKKIILFLLLISSLYSDAKVYIGANIGTFNESFNGDTEAFSSSQLATIKIGYADRDTYGVEFSLDYMKNRSKIFSSDEKTQTDGDRYGLNVSLTKAFNYDIYIIPYVKGGFGAGVLDIKRVTQDNLFYGLFNIGGGILLPVNENFDFEIGYDYKYSSYKAIDMVVEKMIYKSNIHVAYFGFNVRY
jgi:hypothetical protein